MQLNADMHIRLAVLLNSLDELSDRGSREPYSGLASACSTVLEGKGDNLKVLCVSMIAWQEKIIMVAIGVINFLFEKDLILEPFSGEL
jgi:hypothetical protein